MKKFLLILIPCLIVGFAIADGFNMEVINKSATTTTKASDSSTYEGYIESIKIDVTGITTGAISIASSSGEVIYTNSAVSADLVVRPRFVTQSSTGTDLTAGTNDWARYLLSMEGITVSLAETAVVTNTYKITVKLAK